MNTIVLNMDAGNTQVQISTPVSKARRRFVLVELNDGDSQSQSFVAVAGFIVCGNVVRVEATGAAQGFTQTFKAAGAIGSLYNAAKATQHDDAVLQQNQPAEYSVDFDL